MPNSDRNSGIDYTYDPKTGEWVPKSPSIENVPTDDSTESFEEVPDSVTGNDSSTQVDSKTEAEKKYIETEFTTLVGDVELSPSEKSVRLKVNNTVEILGVGNYLSGKYFISGIKRTISKDEGYSQSLTVLKNGFGDSLKKAKTTTSSNESRNEVVEKSDSSNLVKGSTVKLVGKDAVYTNNQKVSDWAKDTQFVVIDISSDGSIVQLQTGQKIYSRYVRKIT